MAEEASILYSGKNFICLCFMFISLLIEISEGRTLKFVTIVYRHGDRSPINSFPSNPIKENAWPQGFGQLTTLGMQQHYELGQFLRKRYSGFLNTTYDHREIYIRSTDYDRAQMSAQANLAGLYPPQGSQVWNSNISWQPIPVHTVPVAKDRVSADAGFI
ncbi:lysosomal acid phosphatase-like [Protopterus annectens]|uniref:lysosomal acid phosphatase-like n=1 Tax=Protopterus annectens TaxID=7888 RepID=UPI001CFA80B5|nr:lysosomal acid phosphatase-like [Protopterus annectens]